ncbi:hypothetical protein JCM24511_03660 [Saitozyma sp. JCM 24511]|nr:hypothetical protein JCM24511_03660 [Saitozyma sp. JCM 24511]
MTADRAWTKGGRNGRLVAKPRLRVGQWPEALASSDPEAAHNECRPVEERASPGATTNVTVDLPP